MHKEKLDGVLASIAHTSLILQICTIFCPGVRPGTLERVALPAHLAAAMQDGIQILAVIED